MNNDLFAFSLGEVVAWLLAPFGVLFQAVFGFALGALNIDIT